MRRKTSLPRLAPENGTKKVSEPELTLKKVRTFHSAAVAGTAIAPANATAVVLSKMFLILSLIIWSVAFRPASQAFLGAGPRSFPHDFASLRLRVIKGVYFVMR